MLFSLSSANEAGIKAASSVCPHQTTSFSRDCLHRSPLPRRSPRGAGGFLKVSKDIKAKNILGWCKSMPTGHSTHGRARPGRASAWSLPRSAMPLRTSSKGTDLQPRCFFSDGSILCRRVCSCLASIDVSLGVSSPWKNESQRVRTMVLLGPSMQEPRGRLHTALAGSGLRMELRQLIKGNICITKDRT
jgi:hypothetical protein